MCPYCNADIEEQHYYINNSYTEEATFNCYVCGGSVFAALITEVKYEKTYDARST